MNVLLVTHEFENQHKFLPSVIRELDALGEQFGRRYRARLVHDYTPNLKHKLWALGRPTVVISMVQLRHFFPAWATVWSQQNIDKVAEYKALEQAGIPVPKWTAVYEGNTPDLSGFDDFVVVKPARGGWGALVRIMKRDKVSWRPLKVEKLGVVSEAMVVQTYIHTGPRPMSYRVGSVFGEPIYAWTHTASDSKTPFPETDVRDERFFAGKSIVATGKGTVYKLGVPDDVLDFARRAHRAFPTIPLLGMDIVRCQATQKLYVLEVNATGDTFHLTSNAGQRIQREMGFDALKQFGGARAVARGMYNRLNEWAGVCTPDLEEKEMIAV